MIDLQECRDEIDVIDSEIIRLFEKRMKSARMLQNIRSVQAKKSWIRNVRGRNWKY